MQQTGLYRWENYVFAVVLLLCAAIRLWPLQYDYFHPDEVIGVEVARHVADSGSLDTNWKNAALPQDFKLPQYNFSGYLLSAAIVEAVARAVTDEPHNTLWALRLWSALLAIAAIPLTFLAGRRLFGAHAALVAALFVAVNPLLAQDSLYARPEPFVTALTLLFILAMPGRVGVRRIFLAALIGGVLVATKISMLALLPLLFVPRDEDVPDGRFHTDLIAFLRRAAMELPRRAAAALPGVVLGFLAAAPFALINREDFVEGIDFLFRQYSAPQWPYGLGEATVPERLAYAFDYFAATAGAPVLILSVAGAAWAGTQRKFGALALFIGVFLFAVRFATLPTFFERNLSHLVPVVLIFAAHGLVQIAALMKSRTAPAFRTAAFATILVATAAPAIRTTHLLLADEVSGKSWRQVAQLRDRMMGAYGTQLIILGADQTYWNLTDENFQICGRWLIEIPHYHSPTSDAALPRVLAGTGFTEVGRFVSKFAYVPTSSLHTYIMPTQLYLFRGDDAPGCRKTGDVADPRMTGEPLAFLAVENDPTWTKSGAYPTSIGFTPDDYYGSWSGTGANTGILRMTADAGGRAEIVLPYLTGPEARHQSLRISDRTSGAELWKRDPLPASRHWTYQRIQLPPGTREIVVEAGDAGGEFGDWQALAPPRALRK